MKTYEESEELSHSDTEITLGVRSILGIFFGLALVCGVFFGFGYSLGRGNTSKTAAAAETVSHAPSVAAEEPSAIKTVVDEPVSDASLSPSAGNKPVRSLSVAPDTKPSAAMANAQPVSESAKTPSANPAAGAAVASVARPAVMTAAAQPGVAIMVQIAAVSRQQDANVLVSALGKLGYSASVRNEPADSLLHVQVGPFATRDEARAMRAKLLNDGYNAILK